MTSWTLMVGTGVWAGIAFMEGVVARLGIDVVGGLGKVEGIVADIGICGEVVGAVMGPTQLKVANTARNTRLRSS